MMVKICGITNREDALAAVEGGASALGFIFYPKSPRCVDAEQARRIAEVVPASIWKVGVFVNEPAAEVARIARAAGLDVAQLHGQETAADFPPGIRIWKALRILEAVPDLDQYPVEAFLLDGMANGRTFDWNLARVPGKRIILAGGLDATNVSRAIECARPWGVDACSCLESAPGRKDHVKLKEFLRAAC